MSDNDAANWICKWIKDPLKTQSIYIPHNLYSIYIYVLSHYLSSKEMNKTWVRLAWFIYNKSRLPNVSPRLIPRCWRGRWAQRQLHQNKNKSPKFDPSLCVCLFPLFPHIQPTPPPSLFRPTTPPPYFPTDAIGSKIWQNYTPTTMAPQIFLVGRRNETSCTFGSFFLYYVW